MGASDDVASAAMSTACAYVRRHPKLLHELTTSQFTPVPMRRFLQERSIVAFLRSVPVKRHTEAVQDLLELADDFVNQGEQARLLMLTYAEQRDSGRLAGLSATRLAVHRAVFTLAIDQGSPLLASLRYLQTLLREQSGAEASPTTVRTHLLRLHRDGLIEYQPGRTGVRTVRNAPPRVDAGVIWLELPADRNCANDPDVVLSLRLTSSQRLALMEYRTAASSTTSELLAAHRARRDRLDRLLTSAQLSEILDGLEL